MGPGVLSRYLEATCVDQRFRRALAGARPRARPLLLAQRGQAAERQREVGDSFDDAPRRVARPRLGWRPTVRDRGGRSASICFGSASPGVDDRSIGRQCM